MHASPDADKAILAEQVRVLYLEGQRLILTGVAAALILVWVLWDHVPVVAFSGVNIGSLQGGASGAIGYLGLGSVEEKMQQLKNLVGEKAA